MGVAGPDLAAVDAPAAVHFGGLGLGREQVGAGAGFAHADDEAQFAAADARQDVLLDVLFGIFEQHRAALAVGDEMQPYRRAHGAKFLRHHVAFEKIALVAAVFFRPGHADPAFGADALAEAAIVAVRAPWPVRDERAGRDFRGNEFAHLGARMAARGPEHFWPLLA